jgi:hypothetical protein
MRAILTAMARTHRTSQTKRGDDASQAFRCAHCRAMVGPLPSGGRQRNHCPLCLYSVHVDGATPGDRASDCNSRMAPVAKFERRNGEEVIVHRCLGCGFERYCRVGADDDWELVAALPLVDAPAT